MKRHSWRKGERYNVCEDCGCRYRRGYVSRVYEQPDGSMTTKAGVCVPRQVQSSTVHRMEGK